MIDFTKRESITVRGISPKVPTKTYDLDATLGTGIQWTEFLAFDLHGLTEYRATPRQLRDVTKDMYANQTVGEELIQWGPKEHLPSSYDVTPIDYGVTENIDFAKMASANTGVTLDYPEYEYNTWLNVALGAAWNVVTGFIPPFISLWPLLRIMLRMWPW